MFFTFSASHLILKADMKPTLRCPVLRRGCLLLSVQDGSASSTGCGCLQISSPTLSANVAQRGRSRGSETWQPQRFSGGNSSKTERRQLAGSFHSAFFEATPMADQRRERRCCPLQSDAPASPLLSGFAPPFLQGPMGREELPSRPVQCQSEIPVQGERTVLPCVRQKA